MTLLSGSRLGPYEIVAPLGAGGMGEVYRARDTRLERPVAIKVLPEHRSSSPEVRQRFEREAKTISQLSHPHICALYDVGHQEGIDYLVMELLEGQTLAERLAKSPLPLDQALRCGIEIADALEKAHRQGIVHRDLKPGNVMLTSSGVKVLDFGLAKELGPTPSAAALTSLPTETPLTEKGTLLGTVQYMSPEQLEGKDADARTDIFALGLLLYEMVTGEKAFTGTSQATLIGAILRDEPQPISQVQPMTPPALDRLVKSCLAKDRDDRWHTAHDVKLQLQWIAEGGSAAGLPVPAGVRRRSRERLAWGIVALLGVALAAALGFGVSRRQSVASERITRLSLLPPEKATFIPGTLAVAPDGNRIAFVALSSEGRRLLWMRPLDALEAQPLAGTEGAISPFWSPDSRFIGFFVGGKLKKIEPSGGVPQTVCDAAPIAAGGGAAGNGRGGAWNRDGTIVFAPNPLSVLYRVPAAGGQPEPLTALDAARQENSHRWPNFLPDGRHFLFFARSRQRENRAIYLGSLDSKVTRRLMPAESNAVFAPPGYLLFLREGTLVALPFDEKTLQWTGEPIRIAERVRGADAQAAASFDASHTGVLAYGSGSTANQQLAWFSREGNRLGSVGPGGTYLAFRLSPDQKRVALDVLDPEVGGRQIWLLDLARDIASRITSEPWQQQLPTWSPDGDRLVFASDREGVFNLSERAASGVGGEKPLLKSSTGDLPSDWSPDGRHILFERTDAGPVSDQKARRDAQWGQLTRSLWVMPLSGESRPAPLLQSPFSESQGRFSPDGRRIAYVSNESGGSEVYVETFPVPTGKTRISTQGGTEPFWRRDGKELFYLAPDRRLMAVGIDAGPSRFDTGRPQPLFEIPTEQVGSMRYHYAVTADGQRFLVATMAEEGFSPTITVVLNWTGALEK